MIDCSSHLPDNVQYLYALDDCVNRILSRYSMGASPSSYESFTPEQHAKAFPQQYPRRTIPSYEVHVGGPDVSHQGLPIPQPIMHLQQQPVSGYPLNPYGQPSLAYHAQVYTPHQTAQGYPSSPYTDATPAVSTPPPLNYIGPPYGPPVYHQAHQYNGGSYAPSYNSMVAGTAGGADVVATTSGYRESPSSSLQRGSKETGSS